MKVPFKIYSPGGNRTALVYKRVLKQNHAKVSRAIMKQFPEVEQVGFVSNVKNQPHLDMMGGEFCGNASRCFVYELLSQGKKDPSFTISGYKGRVIGAFKNNLVSIRLRKDFFNSIQPHPLGNIVNLQGISFLVAGKKNIGIKPENFLKKFSFGYSAVGLLRMFKKAANYFIFPLVYVPSTNTLVEESACGSGSIAAALLLNKLGKGKIFSVIQPSGKKFKVFLIYKNKNLEAIKLSGPVVLEREGFINIPIDKR